MTLARDTDADKSGCGHLGEHGIFIKMYQRKRSTVWWSILDAQVHLEVDSSGQGWLQKISFWHSEVAFVGAALLL